MKRLTLVVLSTLIACKGSEREPEAVRATPAAETPEPKREVATPQAEQPGSPPEAPSSADGPPVDPATPEPDVEARPQPSFETPLDQRLAARPDDPLANALAKLSTDVESLSKAVDSFAELHSPDHAKGEPPPVDELELRADLDLLLWFIESRLDSVMRADLHTLACKRLEVRDCWTNELTPEAVTDLDALEAAGVRAVAGCGEGQGSVSLVPDHAVLANRLAPVLSSAAQAYLVALGTSARAYECATEVGFAGDPNDVSAAILAWDRLATMSVAAYADSYERAKAMTSRYVSLCFEHIPCDTNERLQTSYRSFVANHKDSRWHRVVARFLDQAEAAKWQLKPELLDACMALAPPPPEDLPGD